MELRRQVRSQMEFGNEGNEGNEKKNGARSFLFCVFA